MKINKLKSPKYFVLEIEIISTASKLSSLNDQRKKLISFLLVVKPTNEGSSLGVYICNNLKILILSIKLLFKLHEELMFEPYIGGQEIQVAVLNGTPLGAIELKT